MFKTKKCKHCGVKMNYLALFCLSCGGGIAAIRKE